MRILHTADWHLGRTLFEAKLLDDQAYALDRLLEMVAETRPDAVVVAGDLFDRPVPPADAVRLLDETFRRIVLGHGIPVVAIAGNHDSAERIDFGASLLSAGNLHIRGLAALDCAPVVLADVHGPVHLHPVPYAEPVAVRALLGAEPSGQARIDCHDAAMDALCDRIRAARPAGVRSVLVAHPFVAGGLESESERPLAHVGGASAVRPATLAGFDYVALGHLHRPQTIGSGAGAAIRYSGSLLKYSPSEIGHAKSVSLVELGAPGTPPRIEEMPLVPRRDLRRIEGRLQDLLDTPPPGNREDYLVVRLTDRGPVFDAMAKLRQVYPNALTIERLDPQAAPGTSGVSRTDHRRQEPLDLFAAFWSEAMGEELGPAERQAFRAALADEPEAHVGGASRPVGRNAASVEPV
ncbi:MAG TPA: exonuclease SbcCD subunit D [Azospirillaceae bacterium]|nr:exonuclease SbcCD subunit D [Azospirillaceae bacterium]